MEGVGEHKIRVSIFDNSIENHFTAIDTISKLCGESDTVADSPELQQLSSSITFLREWKHYNYEGKTVRFACEVESCGKEDKEILGQVNLPHLSSAAVPEKEELYGGNGDPKSSKDFVMHVGGSVWGLDWCPSDQERSSGHVNCEFVAVAAHPPDSCYHEIGVPVAGRGVVQIWCILNVSGDDEKTSVQLQRSKQVAKKSNDKSTIVKRPQGRPRKTQLEENSDGKATNQNCTQIKRPKGRPRKKPIEETLKDEATQDNSTQFKKPRGRPRKKANDESLQALAVHYPEDSSQVLAIEPVSKNTEEHMVLKNKGNKRKSATKALSESISTHETTKKCRRLESKATVQYPEDGCQFLAIEGVCEFNQEQALQKHKGKKQKGFSKALSACSLTVKSIGQIRGGKSKAKAGGKCSGFSCPPLLARSEDDQSFANRIQENTSKDVVVLDCGLDNVSGVINSDSCIIPADVALPRVLLCLAHDGKVVWDVKWRPCYGSDSKRKHRMGYLAVLLGNGFLEVLQIYWI